MGLSVGIGARPSTDDLKRQLNLWSFDTPCSSWGPSCSGQLRWAVHVGSWYPAGGAEGPEFQFLLGLLPEGDERDGVLKPVSFLDKRRTLVGRLLARRACAYVLGLESFSDFELSRTHGRKPFLLRPLPVGLPNFNFNVSHDGHWVVLASDPLRLVGADVSAPQRARGEVEDDAWLNDLRDLLFLSERDRIEEEVSVTARYAVFQRIWSAKEAYTKAVGQGLDFGMERIEVTLDDQLAADAAWPWPSKKARQEPSAAPAPSAALCVDMWAQTEWDVQQRLLGGDHWVSVALGPVEEAVDRNGVFIETLRLRGIPRDMGHLRPGGPPKHDFEQLSVSALVPPSKKDDFKAAVAEGYRDLHGGFG
eukprot:TRINITY_DN48830_c0_g1_i1.p1 TRINITY_DN48830_c0_g1~~TRINITY_DN48830_c0_g1_i1.p1  ORF type:complete len:363 (+),score=58.68 TRINITY_DN48830_c0_g1_i1:44-1132(+)